MGKYEWERAKPMIWAMFAAASVSAGARTKGASETADTMLAEFSKRFPVEEEPEER